MKKVSVIIPIYNAERYLPATLFCLSEQEYNCFEVIAVNDCSTDSSKEIIKSFAATFKNRNIDLILVDRIQNGGLCAAINSGLDVATGEYLCFPDADDEIDKNYISSMMEVLDNYPDKKWVRCDYTIVLEEENREYDVHLPNISVYKNDFFDFISKFIPHNAWNMIVEREYFLKCIGKNIYDSRLTQEWSILLPLSFYSDYARCNKILYRYHIRKNAMSSWQNQNIDSVIEHFRALEKLNYEIIDKLITNDKNIISVSEIALKIYYHLMRYKKYLQHNCNTRSESELAELLEMTDKFADVSMYEQIKDLDLYVRIVFDRLLQADTSRIVRCYSDMKITTMYGYCVIYDKPGIKLLKAVEAAYGNPLSVFENTNIPPELSACTVICLIENSQKYEVITGADTSGKYHYIDYRLVRDSLRGWAVGKENE